tara:strand:- start:7277 stop:7738 length:462 start_codon:yes stop_codon:yes gene_type:complete
MKITNFKIFNSEEIIFENILQKELNEILNNAEYSILENKPATNIKKYLIKKFKKNYWSTNNKLFFNSSRKVDLLKDDIGLQIQFGNHAQVWFDVLKLNYLFKNKRINIGMILCLNKEISDQINGGMTNFRDTSSLYENFATFLECPLVFIEIS